MKYRIKCVGKVVWETRDGHAKVVDTIEKCGWTGVRTAYHFDCECYDLYALYCRPMTPGPGCPSGINWPCPRCGGAVTGKPVQHRPRSEDGPDHG